MSTGKTFVVAIALKAMLEGSIASKLAQSAQSIQRIAETANAANAQFQKGTSALKGYEAQLATLNAKSAEFIQLKRAATESAQALADARNRAAELARAYKESGQETSFLKARLDQAKASLERMKGTLTPETYKAARAEVKALSDAHKESAARTKALGKEFEGAKRHASGLKGTLVNQQTTLHGVRTSLAEAGVSTKNFADSQKAAQAALQATIDKEKAAIAQRERMAGLRANHNNKSAAFAEARGNFFDAAIMVGAAVAPLVLATKESIKFESAMADVKKVVDFETPQQFKEMADDVLQLSTKLPMAAEDIAKIVAAGGQSGIAREDLLAFAESATKMGIAFDVTAEQAGDMMAKWRTAFKMNQEEVVGLADKINYLGNNTAASAPLISEVVTRIGPLGEVGGVASGEIAALGASIVGTGTSSEIAATGIKNLILGMSAGEGATKTQAAAFASLGMSAEEVAKRMQTDAKGAILDVMRAIQGLDAELQASTLQDLFGKESIGAIAPLLSNLDNLQKNFDMVGDAAKYAGSMEAEYAARSATTENQIQLAENAFTALQISIGSALLPTIGDLMATVAPLLNDFTAWATENQSIIATIGIAIATLGILTVTLFGVAAAVQFVAFVYASLQLAVGFVKGLAIATKIATAAQWLFNAALNANPIGLVVLAIAALIGIIYVLYQNFEKVQAFCTTIWESPAAAILAFLGGPVFSLIYIVSGIIANWETIKELFTFLWNDPSAALDQFVSFVKSKFGESVAWIEEKWAGLKEMLSNPITAVVNFIKGGDSGAAAASGVDISANAYGGIYRRGAFLTTFAERSAEAAIPIDGSARALSLWRQTGEMLGIMPQMTAATSVSTVDSVPSVAPLPSSGGIRIEYNPTIHIEGAADASVVEALKAELERQKRELMAMFPTLSQRQIERERRLSYA